MMNGLPEICQWLLKRKNIQFTLSGSDVRLLKDFIRMYQELQRQLEKEERLKLDAQAALTKRDAVEWKKETTDLSIKVGDTVKLKSGSTRMTVTGIYGENRASLSWWWDGKMNHLTLDAECLVKA